MLTQQVRSCLISTSGDEGSSRVLSIGTDVDRLLQCDRPDLQRDDCAVLMLSVASAPVHRRFAASLANVRHITKAMARRRL